jgi:hypothetical protein
MLPQQLAIEIMFSPLHCCEVQLRNLAPIIGSRGATIYVNGDIPLLPQATMIVPSHRNSVVILDEKVALRILMPGRRAFDGHEYSSMYVLYSRCYAANATVVATLGVIQWNPYSCVRTERETDGKINSIASHLR